MKFKQLTQLNPDEREKKFSELNMELLKMNTQVATGTPPKNAGLIRRIKKDIARIMMIKGNDQEKTKITKTKDDTEFSINEKNNSKAIESALKKEQRTKELCVCETIAKESQMVIVRLIKKKFGKKNTVIEGLNEHEINLKDLAKKLKTKFACGGTAKDGIIELQGNYLKGIKTELINLGFSPDTIELKQR